MNTIICFFFIYLIEAISLWQYTSNLFEAKSQVRKRLTILISLFLILFIASLFKYRWFNALLFLLINVYFFVSQFDLKWYFSIVLGFIPITSVFLMTTFVCIGQIVMLSSYLEWMIVLNAVFLLAINLFMFRINQYNKKKSAEFTEMQLLLQKESDSAEYYEMLRLQNENQRILIHDIKKHLQSIDMLNDQKEHDKINAYIKQLIISSDLKESVRLCDNEMLNLILYRYMRQCDKKHIAFHADIRSKTTDFIANNDLTSLFCNLLENAMEAAEEISESFIEINTSRREKTSFIVITVINSCRKNPFSMKNGNLLTHKSDKHKHGFGIKSIRRVIEKYHGDMRMYYNDDTLTFHTIITLKQ